MALKKTKTIIGKNFRRLLREYKFRSLYDFNKRVPLSYSSLNAIARGDGNPAIDTVLKLTLGFPDMTPENLVDELLLGDK